MSQSLITDYSNYQQQYESKCNEWRSEPVGNRTCNDVGCVVVFFILLGFFIGVGGYYIHEKGNNVDINNLYVSDRAGEIAACLAISMVISFIYILLIKIMPKAMVYCLIVLSMSLLFGIGILGFIIGELGLAIPFLVTFVVYALVLMCLRKKIDMGIILIKVASQFLSQKWAVFISPIIKVVLNVLFSIFWIYSLSCILAVADDKSNKGDSNTAESVFVVLWFFIWLFFGFLFYYFMVFTIAVACSFWYYKVEGRNYLLTAYRWLFTSAFGSIVFGSFLIALITFARMIVDSKRRENKNIAVAICLCLISFCLKSIENLLQILNHNCVIVMSVTGENYINSAKTTIGILSRFLGLMSISNIITGLLVFWGVVIVAGLIGVISFFWIDGVGGTSGEVAIVVIVSVLGSIMVSSLIFSVLVEAVSSVFIFYCFDVKFKEMGYSSNNMPAEINEALGNYSEPNYESKQ